MPRPRTSTSIAVVSAPIAGRRLIPRRSLLLGHDHYHVAGTVDEISVDRLGRVVIVATVTDPLAMRMPALSISASVDKFTIERPDRFDFVGEVERVTDINEISLTTTPSNRRAVVFERWIPTPVELSNELLLDKFKAFQASVAALCAKGAFATA
jgi:hypothetical protein